jgi:hypothetical protein
LQAAHVAALVAAAQCSLDLTADRGGANRRDGSSLGRSRWIYDGDAAAAGLSVCGSARSCIRSGPRDLRRCAKCCRP